MTDPITDQDIAKEELRTTILHHGYLAGYAYLVWRELAESEDPQMQEVSDAWEDLTLRTKNFKAQLDKWDGVFHDDMPCEDCPD